ncbi:MAG: sodium-translocating pyrophosphatase [Oscillospiraceae bacterium]|nr:sodium-translocating pyrophosphatase [Oscillospiraceae bacterium]
MEHLFFLGLAGAILALVFAAAQAKKVLSYSEGDKKMVKIADSIRQGADAYLARQFKTVIKFFVIVFIGLCALAFLPPLVSDAEYGLVNRFVPFAFISGGLFTYLSGYIGMKIATRANARTTQAASESLNKGLRVSFSAGSVMGFVVVGLTLLDITAWFLVLRFVFNQDHTVIGETMIKFGLGVAFMAMFARVGGGIFTKAADVGADLVGKVEAGIPEDDPRNPAVIADNVGDNVGDVAGMGADLYEAYAHAIIGIFALAVVAGYGYGGLLLPMLICVVGVVASIIGSFAVRTKEDASQKSLLKSLHRGTWLAAALTIVAALPITYWVASMEEAITFSRVWGIFGSIVIGAIAGIVIAFFSEHYTSDTDKPTRELAESSETGSATIIIGGLSLGMKSVAGPILTVALGTLISYIIAGGLTDVYAGLYGIGIAAVGLVATLGINLATDAFGPVADNAGGIAQMAELPEVVRDRTDALDSLGNTTAATGKGFAIGATAFTALALLVSYVAMANDILAERSAAAQSACVDHAFGEGYLETGIFTGCTEDCVVGLCAIAPDATLDIAITSIPVLIGLFIGIVTVFFFAALTIEAVHKAAQSVVHEVRRQFREIKGLMEGTADADYATCVDLCTKSALKKMVGPSLLAIVVPIVTGVFLGAGGVVGMMTGIIITGFALAIFMMTSGGAWDNAKKYVESGHHGGKGGEQHKAAVVGDTVGDPLKDTAGPSFNILITLSSSVALVFIGVTMATALIERL